MCQDAMLQPGPPVCAVLLLRFSAYILFERRNITDKQQSIGFKRISSRLTEKEMTLANNSKDTPKRTEARFKKEERAREGAQAMLEYEAEGRAVREKTVRLRALRLAAEAGKKDAAVKAAAKQAKGSVKKAASKVTGVLLHTLDAVGRGRTSGASAHALASRV
jgi:hypothetical protein